MDNRTFCCKGPLHRRAGGDDRVPTEEAFAMAAQLDTHPSADALRGFAVGQLDDRTAAVIMNHLDSCPDCCRAAAALSGDDFLDRLRQANSPSSSKTRDDTGGITDEGSSFPSSLTAEFA